MAKAFTIIAFTLRAIGVLVIALVLTAVSLPTETLTYAWGDPRTNSWYFAPGNRPMLPYAVATTFLGWSVLLGTAYWLKRRTGRKADTLWVLPGVYAGLAMLVSYGYARFLDMLNNALPKGQGLSAGLPWKMYATNYLGGGEWDLAMVAANFAFWLGAFSIAIYPWLILARWWRKSHNMANVRLPAGEAREEA